MSLETYNGRFTALVNKYFLLNNIREKRDARGPLHSALARQVKRETAAKEKDVAYLLTRNTMSLRAVDTQTTCGKLLASLNNL